MSDTQVKQNDDVDAGKTAKFLANLQRTMTRRDPDDPAPATIAPPPAIATTAPAAVAVAELATAKDERPAAKPAKRKVVSRSTGDDDEYSMQVRLDPGTGKRVVYVRVDKTLADRLQLIAFQNKITGGDGPTTINDIGIEALHDWLAKRAA